MGKGGAQLGKFMKGKSKEIKREAAPQGAESTEQQWKIAEEYERLAKLAESQHERLKVLQQQENQTTYINEKLLFTIHRNFMRLNRVDDLRRDIEVLAQNHERTMDRKASIIQMLTRDLDDAEEQFQTSQRTQMDKMQTLINLHNQKLAKLQDEFERDIKILKTEFKTEKDFIITKHTRETNEMKSIIQQIEQAELVRFQEAKQAHETEKEEIRSKKEESINELKISLENKIAELAKKFDEAHDTYVEQTHQMRDKFNDLLTKDDQLSVEIGGKKKDIDRCIATLTHWKKKIEGNAKECKARNDSLKDQKQAILSHCNSLKARMKRFRQEEARKLAELTTMSRTALKSNEDNLAIASRVIQLAELARRFQTEREKVSHSNHILSLPIID
jgi:hypothetical protein